tara:strand:+ start:112 stop:588 length:477 start_codon:yes stop_codon:yes gene_type:complete
MALTKVQTGSVGFENQTDELHLPKGTTAQREAAPTQGAIRFNTTLTTWEGYQGSVWTGLGGGNPWATKTSNFTAAANDRLFVDTSGGAVTITLPASPLTGDEVSIVDVSGSFDSNNCTVGRNSEKIMGAAEDLVITQENAGIKLAYSGSTNGWRLVNN